MADPLRYFVAFGSISGRFGANGHTDYSLANDMLCKEVDWFRRLRPDCAAVAFHWHAWGDVGMATKPETKLALELIDMQFMPATEGVEHLIAELETGAAAGEVLITDFKYYRMFYPAETLVVPDGGDTSASTSAAAAPLLNDATISRPGERTIAELRLLPTSDPFLVEHRLNGQPILPVVIGIELLAEAARIASGAGQVAALRDVDVANSMKFPTSEPRIARIIAEPQSTAEFACRLTADVRTRDGQLVEADRLCLSGIVELTAEKRIAQPTAIEPPGESQGRWQNVVYPRSVDPFYLGPPMRCLRKTCLDGATLWGRIIAPALVELAGPQRRVEGWAVPSALLDACLFATGLLAWQHVQPGTALPRGFGRIELGYLPQPGEACVVRSTFRERNGQQASFDFCLFGSDGRVIFDVRDYRVVWLMQS